MIYLLSDAPSSFQLAVQLVQALVWPVLVVVGVIKFRKNIDTFMSGVQKRMEANAPIKFMQVELGSVPTNLPEAISGEIITAEFMALVHSSWRYPKMDAEYGTRMWVIHVVIQARDEVLDRIESAKYLLDPAYPNPVQVKTDRATRFELKELANGESNLRCEVKIKGQSTLVQLERYINLTDSRQRL